MPPAALPWLLWGSAEKPNQRVALAAGPLQMVFEPQTGFLRHVRCGGHELIRGVYAAVRGPGWRTITPVISSLVTQVSGRAFSLSFHAVCHAPPVWFEWDGAVRGTEDGTVTFSMNGIAHTTFMRNRIGFCVLHPIEGCAGEPCVIEHTDGTLEHGKFPYFIAPHQPFQHLRAITHTIDGVETRAAFEGEVFEMEDQRNWTDASFKTYGTPLELPTPVQVAAGTRLHQSVTIAVRAPRPAVDVQGARDDAVRCTPGGQTCRVPALGVCLPHDPGCMDIAAVQRLRTAIRPAHLRIELHLAHDAWRAAFAYAVQQSRNMCSPLELALVLPEEPDAVLRVFAEACSAAAPDVARCLLLAEGRAALSHDTFTRARHLLDRCATLQSIGTGTNRYFTELNREHPPRVGAACIAYSCNPQVHAFDNASMAETVAGLAWTVTSARAFCADLPLAVSPLTLRPRVAPHDAHYTPAPPEWADPRQCSLFCCGFALGSIAQLALAGARSITLFDSAGWSGIIEDVRGAWLRHLFGTPVPHAVYPVYHLLADLADYARATLRAVHVDDPLRVQALLLEDDGRQRICLANLTPAPVTVVLAASGTVHVRTLDEHVLARALAEPDVFRASSSHVTSHADGMITLSLGPNAYVRIDLERT